jgi:hypothetical protein
LTGKAAINHVQQRPEGTETRSRRPRKIIYAVLSKNDNRRNHAEEAIPVAGGKLEQGTMHPDLSNGGDVSKAI